ncbi:hypothetical protein ACFWIW_10800 [Amycolatopsis sp. NPDC058340]|uniref:hypothetical protein n=1 Tax=Amycolatopsis sp. NPDC058340 TaxID=3346453 RepID=UPI0036503A16
MAAAAYDRLSPRDQRAIETAGRCLLAQWDERPAPTFSEDFRVAVADARAKRARDLKRIDDEIFAKYGYRFDD